MSSQTIFLTAGATSKTVDIALVQNAAATSPGDPITGLAYNTASLTAYYRLGATGTLTAISLATQTVGGAYSSGGFVEVSSTNAPGQYRFDIPNACIASAGFCAITLKGATNMATHTINVIVTAVDLYDTVRMGLTALPNVASGNSGAIPTVGTGTAQISVTGGRANADVVYWNGAVLTGKTGAFPEFGIIDSGTAQSATGTTLVLRSAAAFADDELIGATILIVGATAGAGQRRVINDYVGSTDTATVDTWTTTPTGTIVYAIFGSAPASTGSPIAVDVSKWAGTTVATPDTAGYPKVTIKDGTGAGEIALTAGVVDTVGAVTGAVGSVTGAVGSVTGNVGGNVTGSVGSVATGGITAASIAADAIGASELATDAVTEIVNAVWAAATRSLTVLDEDSTTIDLDATIQAALNTAITNIASILALLDDPRTEPGQGAPAVNPDLATKIDYLYKAWRNRSTQTSTTYSLYADDATTIDQKATVSDDGTTFVKGEVATGP